jgi:predicted metal-binding protein
MSKHTLFICEACNCSKVANLPEPSLSCAYLLDQALELSALASDKLDIQPAGCLWTCDRPCSAAFIAPGKFTYHFADLPLESAQALLEFSTLYIDSEDGYVLPAHFPELLRSKLLVRIPPVSTAQGTA